MKNKSILFLLGFAQCIYGNPEGGKVVSGEAKFSGDGTTLRVDVSNRAVLNWDSFSIQPNELTRFVQPSRDSAVLNRVTGGEMSRLMGTLESNGKVYLVNPNGVVVGKEGRIDTAGFIAAALEIRPEEFIAGNELRLFGDSEASLVNLGTIESDGGPVALLGHRIENSGVISAPGSYVSLIAGHEILLQPSGNALLFIRPDLPSGGVDQKGAIRALEAQIQADGAIPLAINLDGTIQANSVVAEGGRIYLRANEGAISVRGNLEAQDGEIRIEGKEEVAIAADLSVEGQRGGKVYVYGEKIELATGRIDASGLNSAGEIIIGQKELDVFATGENARRIVVQEGFEIKADSHKRGDGGKVILLSDREAEFHGHISAQSLGDFGNGGTVEISGRESLICTGFSDLRSKNGHFGYLLHDPLSIIIQNGGNTPPVGNTYNDAYIAAQLGSANFSLTTAPDAGTITFDNTVPLAISWSAATTFQLVGRSITATDLSGGAPSISIVNTHVGGPAFNAIDFRANIGSGVPHTSGTYQGITLTNATITAASGAGIISLAGQGGTSSGTNTAIALNGSTITSDTGVISIAGFFFTGFGSVAPSNVTLQNSTAITSNSGNIIVAAQTGSITLDGTSSIQSTSGNILINSGNSFSDLGGTIQTGPGHTVQIFVLKLLNPPPSSSANLVTVSDIVALAATLAGGYPNQLAPQSLLAAIEFGAGNKNIKVGCATAPVAVAGGP